MSIFTPEYKAACNVAMAQEQDLTDAYNAELDAAYTDLATFAERREAAWGRYCAARHARGVKWPEEIGWNEDLLRALNRSR